MKSQTLNVNNILPGKNEMNRALGHFCAHIGYTGPGEPPENGEMIKLTLSFRHGIRNSSPGGLRPSTLPPHNTDFHMDGEETFFFFQTAETGNRTPNVKGSGANHYPRAPPILPSIE